MRRRRRQLVVALALLALPVAAPAQAPGVNGHGAEQLGTALAREQAALRDIEARNRVVRAELERLREALQASDAEIQQILQRLERLERLERDLVQAQ